MEMSNLCDVEEYAKPYYSVDSQDTWLWASDGGSYFQYTDQEAADKELKDDELWNDYFGVASSKNKCGGLGFWLTLKICISLSLVEMKWMLG